ncbi:hypothetical protein LFML04_0209 [Leptospirillum ferriphilum ML-04]|uniref:Uncharacterized protein n=1 Tax=Leptospirillum ferriphilum (strain ML-04) TaxID=1048260 RepID=J9Z7Q8_LEPFM|nr:hypothetical protein LFML04_0209 [Leptospirillum ferriphilum ML-04]
MQIHIFDPSILGVRFKLCKFSLGRRVDGEGFLGPSGSCPHAPER